METLSLNRFIFPANLSAPNRTTSFALEIRRAALGISTPTLKTHRPFNHTRKSYVITRASITEQEQSAASEIMQKLQIPLADIDPATAKLAIGILSPFLPAFGFLFVIRIVMSWYPKLPVSEFPYVIAYAPTEPILIPTRKLIPPLGGVDVTPVVWFGLISFLNEILVGPQGLLVLLSQQINN